MAIKATFHTWAPFLALRTNGYQHLHFPIYLFILLKKLSMLVAVISINYEPPTDHLRIILRTDTMIEPL